MSYEIPSLQDYREDAVDKQRFELETQGWRPLPDIEYTHSTRFNSETGDFESVPIRSVEDIKRQAVAEYAAEGFDEATVLPTNPFEKDPQSYYVYIRNSKFGVDDSGDAAKNSKLNHAA